MGACRGRKIEDGLEKYVGQHYPIELFVMMEIFSAVPSVIVTIHIHT